MACHLPDLLSASLEIFILAGIELFLLALIVIPPPSSSPDGRCHSPTARHPAGLLSRKASHLTGCPGRRSSRRHTRTDFAPKCCHSCTVPHAATGHPIRPGVCRSRWTSHQSPPPDINSSHRRHAFVFCFIPSIDPVKVNPSSQHPASTSPDVSLQARPHLSNHFHLWSLQPRCPAQSNTSMDPKTPLTTSPIRWRP